MYFQRVPPMRELRMQAQRVWELQKVPQLWEQGLLHQRLMQQVRELQMQVLEQK